MSQEPAIERLRTAAANMEDIEGTFLAAQARVDEVASVASRVARAREEFAAAMDDPVVVALRERTGT